MLTSSTITLDVRADLSTAFSGHDDDENAAPKHPSFVPFNTSVLLFLHVTPSLMANHVNKITTHTT